MTAETRRLLHLLMRPTAQRARWRELATYVAEFLRPGACYYVYDWRDPLPLWRDLRHSVLQRLRQRLREPRHVNKAK